MCVDHEAEVRDGEDDDNAVEEAGMNMMETT